MADAMKYLITMLKSHNDSKERDRTVANSLSDLRSEPIEIHFYADVG